MYIGIKHLHSTIALLALAILAVALVLHIIGLMTSGEYGKGHRLSAMIGMILIHIQLLVGLVIYFLSPLGAQNLGGEAMKEPLSRLYALEHPLINIIAITLITMGHSRAKKAVDSKKKFSTVTIFYGLGLILILSRIPWQTWSLIN